MACPICDQKWMNCDCTAAEREQVEEIEELRAMVEQLEKKVWYSAFDLYQERAYAFAKYPADRKIIYPAIGLPGEVGEVCEKIKKIIRDKNGEISPEDREAIKKELGDVLWYVAALSTDLSLSLSEVAAGNLAKLEDRQNRGKINGEGDDR